jgi:hypothetical protein
MYLFTILSVLFQDSVDSLLQFKYLRQKKHKIKKFCQKIKVLSK